MIENRAIRSTAPDEKQVRIAISKIDRPLYSFVQCGYQADEGVELSRKQLVSILAFSRRNPNTRRRLMETAQFLTSNTSAYSSDKSV